MTTHTQHEIDSLEDEMWLAEERLNEIVGSGPDAEVKRLCVVIGQCKLKLAAVQHENREPRT